MGEKEWKEKVKEAKKKVDRRYRRAPKLAEKLRERLPGWDISERICSKHEWEVELCPIEKHTQVAVLRRVGELEVWRMPEEEGYGTLYIHPARQEETGLIVIAVEADAFGRDTIFVVEFE